LFYELAPIFQEVATKAEKEGKRERFIPNIKVEQFIKMVGENKHFINLFSAANGCGKCLPLDSPILMANGQWKKLGDIKKGDYVLGHDYDGDKVAVPSRVVETSRAGRKEVFKFYFRDGGYVIASKEHSFPLKFRSGRKSAIKKKRIEEVLDRKINYVGGKLKFQQPKAIEFKNGGNLPIHPYLLGALLGDGGLTGGSVRFSNIDERIIKKVRSICGKEGFQLNYEDEVTHRIVDMRNGRSKKGHFGQNRLVQHIKQLKLDIKSGEKFIPDVYKIASVEERKQLLAGLIDTDGTFSEYFTKSKRLAEDFVFLVRTLGGTAKLKERIVNNDFTKGEDALFYRIYWRFDYELPLSAPEKQRVSKKPVEYTNRFVVKVESVGFVECGDIAIEHPKHCYISYDFISTGNTAAGALIITAICFGNIEFDPFYWTPAMQKEFGEPPKSWFDYPLYNKFPFKKKGRIISDPTTIKEQIVPELKKWFPTNRYVEHWTTAKEGKNYECKFITDTGFEIDLMTTEQAPKEFEAVSLGFCIEENQRVLLSNGIWKKIKDIKIGDIVLNTTDTYRKKSNKVIAVHYKGQKQVIKIRTRSGYEIVCTPDHKIWTNQRGWIETSKLKIGDRLYSPRFNFNGQDTIKPEMAFMLGAWLGDGWFSRYSIFIAIANKLFLEEVKNKVEKLTFCSKYDYRIIDNELKEIIIKNDLADKKANTKFIPDFIFKEKNNQIELLKGLYAADGWFFGHTIGYASTSKRLSEDLRLLLHNLDIRAALVYKQRQNEKWNDQYWVLITQKHNVKKFCELIKVNSKRKQQNKVYQEALKRIGAKKCVERYKRDTRKSVISIEKAGLANVYDISVENEHSFICNGLRVSNCWIDEPCPHNIYMATIARGRLGMIIFLTMTPLSYSAWIKDEIFDKRDGKNIEYITATVWDNCVEMEGTRGILTKDNIEKMISQYPIDEREARIEGKFGHLLGRVHKKFDRRIHTIRPFSIKYDDFVVVMAHDTHPRVGDHISWVAIDRKGTKYVIDEMEITGLDHEMAANIKAKEVGWRVIDRLLDPSGWNEDKRTLEKTFAERMYDEGIEYKPGSKHLNEGIRRTNTALDYEERGGILIRQPELYFFNTCEGHIKQFENYVWDEWQGRNVDSKDPKGQPKDKNDHYPENIHRILLENYQFIESEKYEKEREQQESHSFHDKLERFGLISNPLT